MASSTTPNLGLVIFPNISGVYQREIRIALVSGDNCNMQLIDAAIGAIQEALRGLARVASTGEYSDLLNKPTLPGLATYEAPGLVKPDGTTIELGADGLIKAIIKVDIATVAQAGIVKPDGETILIDENGTIRSAAKVEIATEESPGIVKPDGESIIVEEDGTLKATNKDCYSKEEIDAMMKELSEMLISSSDLDTLGVAVNLLMDTNDTFSEIGTDLIKLEAMVDTLLS